MKEASNQPTKSHGDIHRSSRRPNSNPVPVSGGSHGPEPSQSSNGNPASPSPSGAPGGGGPGLTSAQPAPATEPDSSNSSGQAVNTSQAAQSGAVLGGNEKQDVNNKEKKPVMQRFWHTTKAIVLSSKINVLLVFVPVGIAVAQIHSMPPAVIFAMNAVAIVPLAGLLSFATESVAHRLGDSLGALLNVTFGNAVELIIFIIALVKDQIRIVQASLLGSILANLLLILGMSFFLGGLRYREQIYNSTVTQMSACLLSLSVISLVLPTAFHASFSDNALADEQSLKVSRGTSVILLLVYIVYLLFQLLSHAYLYESTPQHIIDEEATPGPAANWLDSSSSDSSSDSDSDSTDSDHSRNTMSRRMRRVMRRRRRSSVVSSETGEHSPVVSRTPPTDDRKSEEPSFRPRIHQKLSSGASDEMEDDRSHRHGKRHRRRLPRSRRHRRRKHRSHIAESPEAVVEENTEAERSGGEPRRVEFTPDTVDHQNLTEEPRTRSPFRGLRSMSFRPVVSSLAPSVFTQPQDTGAMNTVTGPVPRVRYGIRRTNSLPDRLTQHYRPPGAMMPSQIPLAHPPTVALSEVENTGQLSRTAAVILLLVSTALVAVCAEFMVDSINGLVETSSVNEIFIGLIILPIVGNAAEHVTAITVAMKNKMDLAIGVAVGSSIQIALFITPLVVIIGWGLDRQMTLYFTLFETVCLFVSAFITNFLVLDGRSNYLEGALLMSTYVIIAVVAFFYPKPEEASAWGA